MSHKAIFEGRRFSNLYYFNGYEVIKRTFLENEEKGFVSGVKFKEYFKLSERKLDDKLQTGDKVFITKRNKVFEVKEVIVTDEDNAILYRLNLDEFVDDYDTETSKQEAKNELYVFCEECEEEGIYDLIHKNDINYDHINFIAYEIMNFIKKGVSRSEYKDTHPLIKYKEIKDFIVKKLGLKDIIFKKSDIDGWFEVIEIEKDK